MISEPAVTLTDFIVALECAVVAWSLRKAPAGQLRAAFFLMFGGIGVSAFAGALVHGFGNDLDRAINGNLIDEYLWPVTLGALGVMALAGWCIGSLLLLPQKIAAIAQRVALVEFIAYCWYITRGETAFAVALGNYLPPTLFMLGAYIAAYKKSKARPVLHGIAGLLLTFAAAGVQHFKIALHPVYFDHNALFHVMQFVAIILIYLSAKYLCEARHETP